MRSKIRLCALLVAGLWIGVAAPATAADEAVQPSERELRTAMNRAEKRFFDVYNRVNEDGRHDLACDNEERSGSRLRRSRTCRTAGESAISEEVARAYIQDLDAAAAVDSQTVAGGGQAAAQRDTAGPAERFSTSSSAAPDNTGVTVADAAAKLQEERAAFDKHLQGLMAQHPELKQRFDEYLAARSRYQAARGR